MKNILNTHLKLLKKHHPLKMRITLQLTQKPIEGFTGMNYLKGNTAHIKVQVKGRREDEVLHTLAHEYKHAIQWMENREESLNGFSQDREDEAHNFAWEFNEKHIRKNKPQLIWGRYWGPGSEELNKELKETSK